MDLTIDMTSALEAGRRRTLDLLAPFDDDFLRAQHSTLMSPLVWDLAHVGNYEELWLVRSLGGDALRRDIDGLYDAFRHPRAGRPSLPLLSPDEARSYIAAVREVALELVDDASFVHRMVVQHEHQHDETMLATIQLSGVDYEADGPRATTSAGGAIELEPGRVTVGTDDDPWAYDNERPAYEVTLAPFRIDRLPVRNRDYLAVHRGRELRRPAACGPPKGGSGGRRSRRSLRSSGGTKEATTGPCSASAADSQ